MISVNTFERAWINVSSSVTSPDIKPNPEKKTFYVMKDMNTCYVMADLNFVTKDVLTDSNVINFTIPMLGANYVGDFIPCSNTVFALKAETFNTWIKMSLISGGILRLESFPFAPNTKYEMNLQFFFMLKSADNNPFLQSLI